MLTKVTAIYSTSRSEPTLLSCGAMPLGVLPLLPRKEDLLSHLVGLQQVGLRACATALDFILGEASEGARLSCGRAFVSMV